jgi:type IV/VI secretion system ImpK/VasF family protein
MKNPLWSAIYELLHEVDTLLSRGERFGGTPAEAAARAPEAPAGPAPTGKRKAAFFKAYVATDDLVEVRAKIRSKLDVLRASLLEQLTERETFLVLFPLVVFLDEVVQNRFLSGGQSASWPALQTELFKIDDGGEVFYNTLDDLLRKPDTLPFVYEVFYLCLSDGFKGRYADNLAKVNEYRNKLQSKIPKPALAPQSHRADAHSVISLSAVPVARYALVGVALAVAYVALRVVGHYVSV